MDQADIKQKAETIEIIRQKYTAELLRLKKKQNKIIKDFIKALEAKKIDQLRQKLNIQ